MDPMPSLFPYFGGKSSIATPVWDWLGVIQNYVEPFFGSGAVLFGRPDLFPGIETVNDMNGWLCNLWRAIQADPDAVAHHADWPVSELDLHARGDWLFYRPDALAWVERLRSDPDYYDAKSAGWWLWGQCVWIGSGWGRSERRATVARQLPHLFRGRGIDRPGHVNRKRPHLSHQGQGILTPSRRDDMRGLLTRVQERLRQVRICCGDWTRVCGETPTLHQAGITGVFLDPPYSDARRKSDLYADDSMTVAQDVAAWCRQYGDHPRMRIVLCGYVGEHDLPGWTCVRWKAQGGYGRGNPANTNNTQECLWCSPHCVQPLTLFPAWKEAVYDHADYP